MFHFSTPWKRQTTKRFMTFSGGIEMQRLYNGYATIDTVLGQCNEVSNSSCTNFRIDLDTFQYTAAFAAIWKLKIKAWVVLGILFGDLFQTVECF